MSRIAIHVGEFLIINLKSCHCSGRLNQSGVIIALNYFPNWKSYCVEREKGRGNIRGREIIT